MRAIKFALVAAVLVMAATSSASSGGGFAFSLSEGTHEEHGAINGTVTAVYPDCGLTFSWGIGDVPEIVWDRELELHLEFTVLGASNWKEAWVKTRRGNIPVSLKGLDPNPGTILTAIVPSECLVPNAINSIAMAVRDRGSNHRILWIKTGINNWSSSLIRFKMISPLFDERCWSAVTYKGVTVTARQVFLLAHNGGIPSVGSVDRELLKQLVERQMAEGPAEVTAAEQPQDPKPAEQTAPAETAQLAPTVSPPPADLTVKLLGSSTAFRVEWPDGAKGEYSLTQIDAAVWRAWELGNSPFTIPQGRWFLKLRAFKAGQVGPTTCWDSVTNQVTVKEGE